LLPILLQPRNRRGGEALSGQLQREIKQIFGIRQDLQKIIIKQNLDTSKEYTLEETLLEIVGEMAKDFPFNVDSDGMLIAKAHVVEREDYARAPYSVEYEFLTEWFVKWLKGADR